MSGTQTAKGSELVGSRQVIARHPNASVALGSGSGLGALIVWVVGLAGVAMPAEVGAVIAGVVAGFALFVGRRGIKGMIDLLWVGNQSPADARS
jgi:hypothetical protein